MKKLLFIFFTPIVVVLGLFIAILNTTNITEGLVNSYLADKNISVESISSNVVTSLHIKNLRHNNQVVIKAFSFKWHPLDLFYNHVNIEHMTLKDIDINATMLLANAFKNKQSNETKAKREESVQSNPFEKWRLDIKEIAINGLYDQYQFDISSSVDNSVAHLAINVDTPITHKSIIEAKLDLKTLHYQGTLNAGEEVIKEYRDLLLYSKVDVEGDLSKIELSIDSKYITGSFVSQDFNHSIVTLYTKKDMPLKGIVPKELEKLKVYFALTSSLHLQGIRPLFSYVDFKSNLINIKLDGTYNDEVAFRGSVDFPKDSLLQNYDKNLHLDQLGTVAVDVALDDDYNVDLRLKAKELQTKLHYKNKKLDALIELASQSVTIKGDLDGSVVADIKIASIKQLLRSIKKFYRMDAKLGGELFGTISLSNQKNIDLKLHSKQLYIAQQKISNISLDASSDMESLTLNNYSFMFDKMKFFATKDSILKLKDFDVNIESFWLNDELIIKGIYNTSSSKGKLDIHSDALNINHPSYVSTKLKSDVEVVLDGNLTKVDGVLKFLGGKVRYQPDSTAMGFSLDNDIIIKQKKPKKRSDSKLLLNLSIISENPFVYKNKDANIGAKIFLQLTNDQSQDIKAYGMVQFVDWTSYYMLQNKKIRLYKESGIHFIGDPTMPNLDIKAYYKGLGAEVEIIVVGDPRTPVLNFSSKPSMSREQILSLLLLDTAAGAGANTSEDLQYILGGALAKSFLSNLGLRVDHFVISDSKFEIGRKIGDKITIIYLGDEVSSVKMVYDYSKNVEADFIINKESSSMNIFYKGEL